jgi:hypothetical protein
MIGAGEESPNTLFWVAGGGARNAEAPALTALAVVVGFALIVLAIVYRVEPAGSLPSWIPGYQAGSAHHHVKHGIAAFFVWLACLVCACSPPAGSSRRRRGPDAIPLASLISYWQAVVLGLLQGLSEVARSPARRR